MLALWEQYKWYILAGMGGILVILLIIWSIVKMVKRSHLKRDLALQNGIKDEKTVNQNQRYILKALTKDEKILERNPIIPELWIKKLKSQGNAKILKALMTYGADHYHFDCFMASLEKKKLMEIYYPYLQGEDDMYRIERLAHSCHGRDFDAAQATPFLKGSLYSLRDLTGSPDWDTRFFAFNLLIHSDNEKAKRSLWEGLKDPHPTVRSLILRKIKIEEKKAFYDKLKDILINDPNFEVRKVARKRIFKEYRSYYDINAEELNPLEQRRILELLDQESDKDQNFALEILQKGSDFLAQAAVGYLNQTGYLKTLFGQVRCSDQGEMERVEKLLRKSIQVGSELFFDDPQAWKNEGSLLLASRILQDSGSVIWINKLAEAVFLRAPRGSDYSWELYRNTVKSIDLRGTDRALKLKSDEIYKYKDNNDILTVLLDKIPEKQQFLFKDSLLEILEQKDFSCYEILRKNLAGFKPSLILPDLFGILQNGNSSLMVKQEVLKILVLLKQPYTIQVILENLPLLDFRDLVDMQEDIAFYDGKDFQEKIDELLNSYDATIRSSIIAILPEKSAKKYKELIESSLKDSYADVRIAAAYKLESLNMISSKEEHLLLLKDPVDRVRITAAGIFAEIGDKDAITALGEIINNNEEILSVRKSVIKALVEARGEGCLEPVMEFLEKNEILEEFTIEALASRTDKDYLTQVVEQFRDASSVLREKLIRVFVAIGEDAEETLANLLSEQVASLQEYLVDIMEQTGFIENLQRKLSHRKPDVRRRTTEILSLIGTRSAFKGIVLAAKDPDPQVRVNVTRALEKLNSPNGKELLKALQEDPEQRVRRYTQWALERIKVKGRL